jgi:hypothetical protein
MNKVRFLVMALVSIIVSASGFAATWTVQVDPGGWYPQTITIAYGDSVRFYNYTGYPSLTVYEVTSLCGQWIIDVPNNGYVQRQFNCGPGTMDYRDSTFFFDGQIIIAPPATPTPTPDPNIPATSPAGAGLLVVGMSLLLAVSVFRKR